MAMLELESFHLKFKNFFIAEKYAALTLKPITDLVHSYRPRNGPARIRHHTEAWSFHATASAEKAKVQKLLKLGRKSLLLRIKLE